MESYPRYTVYISLHRSIPKYVPTGDSRRGSPSGWPIGPVCVDPPARLTESITDVPKEFPLAPIASFNVGYGLVIVVIHDGHLTD
jgi:hypothetical protein